MSAFSGEDAPSPEGLDRKRKRQRTALSCTECKRRKIKCDRSQPCSSCIRRKVPDACTFDDPEDVPHQPFALAEDLDLLSARLRRIEERLHLQPAPAIPKPIPTESSRGDNGRQKQGISLTTLANQAALADGMDETAVAVMLLEEIAIGRTDGDQEPFSRPGDDSRPQRAALRATHTSPTLRPLSPTIGQSSSSTFNVSSHRWTHIVAQPPVTRDKVDKLLLPALAALPSSLVVDDLVQLFFSDFDWSWKVLHRQTFLDEVEQYKEHLASGTTHLIDPAWVAVLGMVLVLSISSLPRDWPSAILQHLSVEDVQEAPSKWFSAVRSALSAAQMDARPQCRVLYTILLFGPFLTHFAGPSNLNHAQFVVWLGSGLRLAHLLGLNRLGNDPHIMPHDDVAWPPGASSFKREMAKRVWYRLVLLDWSIGLQGNVPSLVQPDTFDTALPLNCNDSDLSLSVLIEERHPSELTDMSLDLVHWQLALQQRKVEDLFKSRQPVDVSSIMQIDTDLRKILKDSPAISVLHSGHRSRMLDLHRRQTILGATHSRLLRLHRPFLAKGFKEERFRVSTDACVASAKALVALQCGVDDAPARHWKVYVQTLSAGIVLFVELWDALERGASSEELNSRERVIEKAILQLAVGESVPNASIQAVASQAKSVLKALFRATAVRRQQAPAQGTAREIFGSVFRDIIAASASANQSNTLQQGHSSPAQELVYPPLIPPFPQDQQGVSTLALAPEQMPFWLENDLPGEQAEYQTDWGVHFQLDLGSNNFSWAPQ